MRKGLIPLFSVLVGMSVVFPGACLPCTSAILTVTAVAGLRGRGGAGEWVYRYKLGRLGQHNLHEARHKHDSRNKLVSDNPVMGTDQSSMKKSGSWEMVLGG